MNAQLQAGRVKGKVAFVAGGGSGIGEATSKLLAKEGARVVVADVVVENAKKIVKEIERDGGVAVANKVDVTQKSDVDNVVRDTLDRLGVIDILINCAGMGEMEWFVDSKETMWDRIINLNLKGTLFVCHAVLPTMIQRKYGKIINIASASGKVGAGTQAVYAATKAGVDLFTKSLAREVARYNINVNDICPGPIDTPMFSTLDPAIKNKFIKGIAFRRLGKPEEIATAALFLSSDESSYITGHSLVVDGGMTFI